MVELSLDRFKNVYIFTGIISLDEELLLYKGNLSSSKGERFGIKLLVYEKYLGIFGVIWFVYLRKSTIKININ